jgi:predicted nucleotide-binding protein
MSGGVFLHHSHTTEDSNGDSNADGPDAANPRARQNVILEHGYFAREPVVALHRGKGALPSDCDGCCTRPMTVGRGEVS